jgi:hypothetical protein
MATTPTTESNLATVPQIQPPDAEAQRRSMALVRTQQFLDSITEIKNGSITLKLAIVNADDYQRAGNLLLTVKSYRKDFDAAWRPEMDRRFEAHRELTTPFNKVDKSAKLIEDMLAVAVNKFRADAERARVAEQKRLQEVAQKQAEEEQRQRQEANQIAAAIEAEQSGNKELAETIIAAPIDPTPAWVAPVILQSSVPKVEGLSTRTTWKARVKGEPGTADYDANFLLLVKAVAEGKAPMSLLKLNDKTLNDLGRAMKTQFTVPGCESYPDTGLSGRV